MLILLGEFLRGWVFRSSVLSEGRCHYTEEGFTAVEAPESEIVRLGKGIRLEQFWRTQEMTRKIRRTAEERKWHPREYHNSQP